MFLPFMLFDTPNTHIGSSIVVFALCLIRLTSSHLGRMNKRYRCICLHVCGRTFLDDYQFPLRIFNTFLSGFQDAIS